MSEAVDRLRRLVEALPDLGDDGEWLAAALAAYASADVSLDAALGLPADWRARERRARRDELIRALAAFFPAPSRHQQATAVADALRAYERRCWPRDRRAATMPEHYIDTPKETLFHLYQLGERVPVGVRQITEIIAGSFCSPVGLRLQSNAP